MAPETSHPVEERSIQIAEPFHGAVGTKLKEGTYESE